jgi:cold shock protein
MSDVDGCPPGLPASRPTGKGPSGANATSPAPTNVFEGRVSWFNLEKQFGFARLADGRNAFLHMSVLKAANYVALPRGTTLRVRLETAGGKLRVAEIVEVDASTANPGEPGPVMRNKTRTQQRPTAAESASAGFSLKELAQVYSREPRCTWSVNRSCGASRCRINCGQRSRRGYRAGRTPLMTAILRLLRRRRGSSWPGSTLRSADDFGLPHLCSARV